MSQCASVPLNHNENFPERCTSLLVSSGLVPDEIVLKLLKKAMVKHQDTNRFLLDGFPRSVDQAKQFERDIAEAPMVPDGPGCLRRVSDA